MDDIVRKEEGDLFKRKVCERDLLGVHDIVIAVFASERCCMVRFDFELPYLKAFGRDLRFVALADGDCVEKPVGSPFIGDELGTVRKRHMPVEPMPVPVLRAGELLQVEKGEFAFLRHLEPLSFR